MFPNFVVALKYLKTKIVKIFLVRSRSELLYEHTEGFGKKPSKKMGRNNFKINFVNPFSLIF